MALVCAVNDSVLRDVIHPEAEKGKTDVGMSRAAGSTPRTRPTLRATARPTSARTSLSYWRLGTATSCVRGASVSAVRSRGVPWSSAGSPKPPPALTTCWHTPSSSRAPASTGIACCSPWLQYEEPTKLTGPSPLALSMGTPRGCSSALGMGARFPATAGPVAGAVGAAGAQRLLEQQVEENRLNQAAEYDARAEALVSSLLEIPAMAGKLHT